MQKKKKNSVTFNGFNYCRGLGKGLNKRNRLNFSREACPHGIINNNVDSVILQLTNREVSVPRP